MFFDNAENIFEFFKGNFTYYSFAFVPLIIVLSISPGCVAHEFNVYRMQQFDLHGNAHGSRNSLINVEARTYSPLETNYNRRCIIIHLTDLIDFQVSQIINQGAAGILIIIPKDFNSLEPEKYKRVLELEKSLLEEEIYIPIYLTFETPQIEEIYESVDSSPRVEKSSSAAQEVFGSIANSGYQLVVSGSAPAINQNVQIPNIQGKLSGFGVEENLPTIALVAHYDSFGLAPSLSFGADSNGSGVVALMELARLLSHLYTSSRTHPRFNVLFLLSGGGKFNFQGTKKWIEDNLDNSESSLLTDSLYTLCLDSIGAGDSLNFIVSKPPREGSASYNFFQELKQIASKEGVNVELVHKKVNLNGASLLWEHEKFSMSRLPAFTVSRYNTHKNNNRTTFLDTPNKVDIDVLERNIKILAEVLVRQIYNTSDPNIELFTNGMTINKELLSSMVQRLGSQTRAAQIVNSPKHPVVSTLEQTLSRYLKDVKVTLFKPDKREPEVVFYNPVAGIMNAYRVKPAVFDLFLFLGIASYLSVVYLIVSNFHWLENLMKLTTSSSNKLKSH